MSKPQVIIFDVNETLLDLAPLKTSVANALGGHEEFVPLWFSQMLHYSLVETLSDHYHGFGEIGTAALMMVAESQGIDLDKEAAQKTISEPMSSLPPHPDVIPALKALAADGFRLVSLTNSSQEGMETQLRNAGLTDRFEKSFSVESVKKFKPHPAPYQMVLEELGVAAKDALMVAAHAWDLVGAKNVGLQTAFVARPGTALYSNVAQPDFVVGDLSELARQLSATKS